MAAGMRPVLALEAAADAAAPVGGNSLHPHRKDEYQTIYGDVVVRRSSAANFDHDDDDAGRRRCREVDEGQSVYTDPVARRCSPIVGEDDTKSDDEPDDVGGLHSFLFIY